MVDHPRRRFTNWETVAVTALPPGWTNVYENEHAHLVTPCPAVLLQEARWSSDDPEGTIKTVHEPPYETRAAFAEGEGGILIAAMDVDDYKETIGPDDQSLE